MNKCHLDAMKSLLWSFRDSSEFKTYCEWRWMYAHDFSPTCSICRKITALSSHALAVKHLNLICDMRKYGWRENIYYNSSPFLTWDPFFLYMAASRTANLTDQHFVTLGKQLVRTSRYSCNMLEDREGLHIKLAIGGFVLWRIQRDSS